MTRDRDEDETPGSLPPEPVEDRPPVGTTTPEDYPLEKREEAAPFKK